MAIDFPNSPAPGDNYTVGAKTWTFTDGKWALNVNSLGVTGATGPSGPAGATGPQGASGTPSTVAGPSGPQGVSGVPGSNGTNGTNGAVGATGPQGTTGATGPQGIQGPSGPAGPQGAQGTAGAAGTNGTNGAAGAQGPQGVQGPAGNNGADGAQGPAGPGANQGLNTSDGVAFQFVRVSTDGFRQGGAGMNTSASTNGVVLRSDGIFCSNTSSSVSRRKYKENIVDMGPATPTLLNLRPRHFKWTDELVNTDFPEDIYDMQTQKQYGFIVEEVLEAEPDLVHHEMEDGQLSPHMWKSNAILALAIKTIQELEARISQLESNQ